MAAARAPQQCGIGGDMIHDHPLAYARGSAAGLFVAPHQSQRCGTDKTPPAKSVMRPAPIRWACDSFCPGSAIGRMGETDPQEVVRKLWLLFKEEPSCPRQPPVKKLWRE